MKQIRWSPRAAEDLEHIFEYIAKRNQEVARRVVKTIYDGCSALKDSPHIGRPGRLRGRRELVFAPLPYIAVYRVTEEAVEISRIYHGAQNRP